MVHRYCMALVLYIRVQRHECTNWPFTMKVSNSQCKAAASWHSTYMYMYYSTNCVNVAMYDCNLHWIYTHPIAAKMWRYLLASYCCYIKRLRCAILGIRLMWQNASTRKRLLWAYCGDALVCKYPHQLAAVCRLQFLGVAFLDRLQFFFLEMSVKMHTFLIICA